MNKEALLFINGEVPKNVSINKKYDLIGCTDGAFSYAKKITNLDFVLGDFDSIEYTENEKSTNHFIVREDQNKTDFEKAVEYLIEKGVKKVDVFGATGKQHDHFLGNLSVSIQFKKKISITFYDDFGRFFLAKKVEKINTLPNTIISLVPMGKVKNITTKGLQYALLDEDLKFGKRIGTRNLAILQEIEIYHKKGELFIFIQKENL